MYMAMTEDIKGTSTASAPVPLVHMVDFADSIRLLPRNVPNRFKATMQHSGPSLSTRSAAVSSADSLSSATKHPSKIQVLVLVLRDKFEDLPPDQFT